MTKKFIHGKASLPFLVTLTGCVLMLACMSPVNATEITKQLSVKGYALSRRNVNELHIVIKNAREAKTILETLHFSAAAEDFSLTSCSNFFIGQNHSSYADIFSKFVKRSKYKQLRSWLIRV
jgi:hypothetical protein